MSVRLLSTVCVFKHVSLTQFNVVFRSCPLGVVVVRSVLSNYRDDRDFVNDVSVLPVGEIEDGPQPVSYTHLDVYKRQTT